MKPFVKFLLTALVIGIAIFLIGVCECQRTSTLSCGIGDSNIIMAFGALVILIVASIKTIMVIRKLIIEDGKSPLSIILSVIFTLLMSALILLSIESVLDMMDPSYSEPEYTRILWVCSRMMISTGFWTIAIVLEASLAIFYIIRSGKTGLDKKNNFNKN